MSNNLIDIYKNILAFAGMSTDDTDMVAVKLGDKSEPVLIDGKRLVLPTQEHLGSAYATSKIIFHPLNENIIRGESDVVSKLRTSFKIKFNYTTAVLGQTLLKICASIAEHKHLTPEQSEMLSEIKDVDDNTFVTFGKIMVAAMKTNADKAFVNLFLKSGAKLGDRKYSRAGIVSFPMYEELLKGADSVFGVKIRVKDRKAYIQLFEYMYTHIKEPNLYNIGSNSQIAPFLEALLNTSAQLAENLNRVIELFKDKIDNPQVLMFNSDWMDGFDKLEDLLPQIRNIPIQAGNDGVNKTAPTAPAAQPAVQQSPVVYPNQQPQQQMMQQQPTMQQMPMQMQQPMMQQPMQPQGLIKTENGLDFRSVLRSNQDVAQTVMNNPLSMGTMPMNPMMMQQQMPQQPRWAQPQQQQMPMQMQQPMMQQMPMQMPMQMQQPMMQQMPMQMPMQMQQPMMQQMPMQMPMQMQQPMMQQQMMQQQPMMPVQQMPMQQPFMNR